MRPFAVPFIGLVMSAVLAAWASPDQAGLSLTITGVQPQVMTTYTWTVSNVASKNTVLVPVGDNSGWAQVKYTTTYTRTRNSELTYALNGNLNLQSSSVGYVIQLPTITATSGSGRTFNVPSSSISCPSLTVPAGGVLTCTFSAQYTGNQPTPGTMTASVSVPGSSVVATAPTASFDFTGAEMVDQGGTATISSYFEQGDGIMQPYGVSGQQPPPSLLIEDGREFQFTGVFGKVDASNCGQQWTAVNTAQVQPSADSLQTTTASSSSTQQAQATVIVSLVGCSTSGSSTPGFSDTSSSPATPTDSTPIYQPAPAPAPSPSPATGGTPSIPGVTFAEAGSTLCGSGACAPGSRCFDGWNCCPENTPICGSVCCDGGRVCLSNQCAAAGSTLCGDIVCATGQSCFNNVCCTSAQQVCGTACCDSTQTCIQGQCVAAGSTACGTNICSPTQQCAAGNICCNSGEVGCNGLCCGGSNTCLQNQFCVPFGSTVCGGTVCQAPQQCAGGALCCDQGATFCSGTCCASGNQCQSGMCIPPGSTVCGSNICSSSQTCQGGTVCCDSGATFCNNGCCAQGNTCINNQCVPTGSVACGPTVVCPVGQFCGNSNTGICCQNINQIGCFTTCCNTPAQVCNQFTQQCSNAFNTACAAGTTWCAAANMCCPAGQVCSFGQCLQSNAVGTGGGVVGPGVTPGFWGRRLLGGSNPRDTAGNSAGWTHDA